MWYNLKEIFRINMKNKVITGLLEFLVVLGMATPALADTAVNTKTINEGQRNDQINSTIVSTDVNSSFTMSIPATATLTYGVEDSNIGNFSVYGNLKTNQSVSVTINKGDFRNVNDNSVLPYKVTDGKNKDLTNLNYTADDIASKTVTPINVHIDNTAWQLAHAGKYQGSIQFDATLNN